jgi:hypothetical protein
MFINFYLLLIIMIWILIKWKGKLFYISSCFNNLFRLICNLLIFCYILWLNTIFILIIYTLLRKFIRLLRHTHIVIFNYDFLRFYCCYNRIMNWIMNRVWNRVMCRWNSLFFYYYWNFIRNWKQSFWYFWELNL